MAAARPQRPPPSTIVWDISPHTTSTLSDLFPDVHPVEARAGDDEQECPVRAEREGLVQLGDRNRARPARGEAVDDLAAGDGHAVVRRPLRHLTGADAVGRVGPEPPSVERADLTAVDHARDDAPLAVAGGIDGDAE